MKYLIAFVIFQLAFWSATAYDNLDFGVPSQDDFVVNRLGYALGYREEHEQAAWVSYKLTSYEVMTKKATRSYSFVSDKEIPTGSASKKDYAKSGYDLGHLAPARDMRFSSDATRTCFYLSNISPQNRSFNRGVWKRLENWTRKMALKENEIFVITGPIFPAQKSITIGANKVTVPEKYFKIIYDVTPPEKMIAFIVPNEESDKDIFTFAVTVDTVESITGLDFFQSLPPEKQKELESKINVEDWR